MYVAVFDVLNAETKNKLTRITLSVEDCLDDSLYSMPVLFKLRGFVDEQFPNKWLNDLQRNDR